MSIAGDGVAGRIGRLVEDILKQNGISEAVASETRLADIGLASMDMVSLMLAVEAEFDLTIPQDDITPENFQSVASIARLVAGLSGGSGAQCLNAATA